MRELPLSWCVVTFILLVIELNCSFFFIGLPAFKPGEKVEIDFSMDDL